MTLDIPDGLDEFMFRLVAIGGIYAILIAELGGKSVSMYLAEVTLIGTVGIALAIVVYRNVAWSGHKFEVRD